jgi:hypothetical protein
MLNFYASNQENIIRKIASANQNKQFFKIVLDWLNQLQRVPLPHMRQVMTNLERFRADALKMPQIFGQPPEMTKQSV